VRGVGLGGSGVAVLLGGRVAVGTFGVTVGSRLSAGMTTATLGVQAASRKAHKLMRNRCMSVFFTPASVTLPQGFDIRTNVL
jgi:hypothetical protein